MNKSLLMLKNYFTIAENAKNAVWGGLNIQKQQMSVKGILAQRLDVVGSGGTFFLNRLDRDSPFGKPLVVA